jgi:hypothetical protein
MSLIRSPTVVPLTLRSLPGGTSLKVLVKLPQHELKRNGTISFSSKIPLLGLLYIGECLSQRKEVVGVTLGIGGGATFAKVGILGFASNTSAGKASHSIKL